MATSVSCNITLISWYADVALEALACVCALLLSVCFARRARSPDEERVPGPPPEEDKEGDTADPSARGNLIPTLALKCRPEPRLT